MQLVKSDVDGAELGSPLYIYIKYNFVYITNKISELKKIIACGNGKFILELIIYFWITIQDTF